MKRALCLFFLASFASCQRELPPQGEIVLHVDTDTIVRESAAPDPSLLSPLVDRARFEVLEDGKPLPGSTRDVPIDAAMSRDRRLSFGIVPPPNGGGVSVRIRLFRADRASSGEPPPGVTMDTTVTLPPVPEEGIVDMQVLLKTDDFGAVIGPVPASPGTPAKSLVGTWHGGKRAACSEGAKPREACVPGASFFLGNPQLRGRSLTNDIYDERLVTLSPFFIDAHEVTVAEFRAHWLEVQGRGGLPPTARDKDAYCTWSDAPLDGEERALNCVTWSTASMYCDLVGKTLPSEAQMELVESGAGEEWAFPWGNDEPSCSAAVWGCAGIVESTNESIARGADNCRQDRSGPGPFAPGQGLADRVSAAMLHSAGGEDVQDLGGNLSEWTRDAWARSTDPFWAAVRPMTDPVNQQPSPADGDSRPLRGGDWASTALVTRAGIRRPRLANEGSPLVGFRCSRPAGTLR